MKITTVSLSGMILSLITIFAGQARADWERQLNYKSFACLGEEKTNTQTKISLRLSPILPTGHSITYIVDDGTLVTVQSLDNLTLENKSALYIQSIVGDMNLLMNGPALDDIAKATDPSSPMPIKSSYALNGQISLGPVEYALSCVGYF